MTSADIRRIADDYENGPYDRIRRTAELLRALAEVLDTCGNSCCKGEKCRTLRCQALTHVEAL